MSAAALVVVVVVVVIDVAEGTRVVGVRKVAKQTGREGGEGG